MATGKMPVAGEVASEFELQDSTQTPRRIGLSFARPSGACLLSRRLVTILSPPVGGLPRSLRRNPLGRGGRGGRIRRSANQIRSSAARVAAALSDFVRYRAEGDQGLGHLQSEGKGRHRQACGVRHRSRSDRPVCQSRWPRDTGSSKRNRSHSLRRCRARSSAQSLHSSRQRFSSRDPKYDSLIAPKPTFPTNSRALVVPTLQAFAFRLPNITHWTHTN